MVKKDLQLHFTFEYENKISFRQFIGFVCGLHYVVFPCSLHTFQNPDRNLNSHGRQQKDRRSLHYAIWCSY
jgi:hypothetical protein